jgi:phage regulator Rha-like protein
MTDTITLAEGTGNQHEAVIKLVRTYQSDLEEFGRVGFEILPFKTAG